MRLSVLSALAIGAVAQDANGVLRWCVNLDKLAACETAVQLLNGQGTQQFSCKALPDGTGDTCENYIKNDVFDSFADFTRAGGVQQYDSYRKFGLKAIVSENDNDAFVSGYTAIAIVKADSSITNLADLAGKNACMTAYGRTAGWQFPIGAMVNEGIIDVVNKESYVPNDEESVAAFFGEVCAPGNPGRLLCGACGSTCDNGSGETVADLYEGYAGAFNGLVAGACDVAFTKYDPEYLTDAVIASDDYRIIGISGQVGTLDQYAEEMYNLGQNSAPVLLVDPDMDDVVQDAIRDAFTTASNNPAFITTFVTSELFGSSTVSLVPVTAATTEEHMGQAFRNYEGTRQARYSLRWCPLPGESTRCQTMTQSLNANFEEGEYIWGCSAEQESTDACAELIQAGGAEFAKFGIGAGRLEDTGHELFDAFLDYGMRAFFEEDYGDFHADSYYAVAVAKKADNVGTADSWTPADLEGRSACFTGYQYTGGWDMPIGTLLNAEILPRVVGDGRTPNDILSVMNFFGPTCAPQTADSMGVGICELCPEHCGVYDNSLDLYRGFKGSYRCLEETTATIAFMQGKTPYQFAQDGSEPRDAWSLTPLAELEFLCSDGTKADVNGAFDDDIRERNYYTCNMGKLPAAVIGTGSHLTHAAFTAGQRTLVRAELDLVWKETYLLNNPLGQLFSVETTALFPALAGTQDYLGPSFELFQAVEDLNQERGDASNPVEGSIRWCIENDASNGAALLAACQEAVGFMNTNPDVVFSCTQLPLDADGGCADYIGGVSPFAEFARAGGAQQYSAYRESGLKAIVSENDNDAFVSGYTAIAIVKADSGITNLADLEGRNACMTAYGRTAGWQFPIGAMVNAGIIAVVAKEGRIPNDEESVAAFFGDVCAPGNPGRLLCGACGSTCDNGSRETVADLYEGYEGAFNGLKEGNCDVAFTKYDTAYLDPVEMNDYRIIGVTGQVTTWDQYTTNNLGQNSAPVLLVDPAMDDAVQNAIRDAFTTASSNPAFMTLVVEAGLFGSSTVSLVPVTAATTEEHMGQAYNNYQGTRQARHPARFCTISAAEELRCNQMVATLNDRFSIEAEAYDAYWGCTQSNPEVGQTGKEACIDDIADGLAEFTTLAVVDERTFDSGHAGFDAFVEYGMRGVMEEDYGDFHGDSYYAVALVKRSSNIFSLSELQGKRVCSTGYGNNAGWDLPIGKLLMDGTLPALTGDGTVPNDIVSARSYFGPSCAPRVVTGGFGICDSCPEHCVDEPIELYNGFKGTTRCLMDGIGEVAFVEGETIYKFAEGGSDPKGWALGRPEDYRLLCGDGTYMDVNSVGDSPAQQLRDANYFNCNLAKVPAGFLATGSHTTHELFTEAQATLVRAEINLEWRNIYLNPENNPDGLIFSADTEGLFRVTAGTQDYLGESFEFFSTVGDLNEGSLGNIPNTGGDTGSSDGISEGEAAGLAFAMLGVGCGCTLLGAYGIRKYRISQQGSSMENSSTFSGTLMNDVGGNPTRAPDMI